MGLVLAVTEYDRLHPVVLLRSELVGVTPIGLAVGCVILVLAADKESVGVELHATALLGPQPDVEAKAVGGDAGVVGEVEVVDRAPVGEDGEVLVSDCK